MVYISKLKNPAHVFEYTDEELVEFLQINKGKEVMVMKTPANVAEEVQEAEGKIQCSLDDAISSTILPTLTMSTEFCDEEIVDPAELKKSEERIERLEKELEQRNTQYKQLQEMYMVLQNRLTAVLAELAKQR